MKNVARLSNEERRELFLATAIKMGMRPEVIEKDFWVCFMLDHLFHECKYRDAFVFKGGTSLSKSYHVIERFSEDIDLILDWRRIITDSSDPWDHRSKTKQDSYNKQINKDAVLFYKNSLVPELNKELSAKLEDHEWITVDEDDEMVLDFIYPQIFETDYIIPHVRLEIGPLAEWMPSHITSISPFAAEQYGRLFEQKQTDILTIDAERTFWEKITILHKIQISRKGRHCHIGTQDIYMMCIASEIPRLRSLPLIEKNYWKEMLLSNKNFTIQRALTTKRQRLRKSE